MKKVVAVVAAVIGLPFVWNGHVYANTGHTQVGIDPFHPIYMKQEPAALPMNHDPTNMWILYARGAKQDHSIGSASYPYIDPVWY